MSLAAGTRIGPYDVIAPIGAGGMGQVYRAHDARLTRDVAIKVLPAAFAADAERRARFEREARAVAALSHPNIVAIFDTGEYNGELFVVMELLEGETLRARLGSGALPVRKAIEIAVQVARGLAGAHERGLVHRDLKPENVFLLADGHVKILDFGLAKVLDRTGPHGGTMVATEAVAATDPGTVMGTVGYMAPEQVRGGNVDARTDLFAFGAVLYEMLSGKRAFHRDTPAETLTAILREEPADLTSDTRVDLSPALERIVRHCLEKSPTERFQSARDIAFALESLSGSGSGRVPSGVSATLHDHPSHGRRTLLVASGAALVLVAAAFAAGARWSAPAETLPRWIGEDLGGPPVAFAPRVSPDGQWVAFVAMVDNISQVGVMKPGAPGWNDLTTRRDRGIVNHVAWSRDGTRIFFDRLLDSPRGIYSVPVVGGEESLIVEDALTPNELPDGSLLFTRINAEREAQLHLLKRGSSSPDPLDALLPFFAITTRLSADGREAIFFGRPKSAGDEPYHYWAIELASGRTRRLVPALTVRWEPEAFGFPLAVTPDGNSFLFNQKSGDLHQIMAAPLDGSDGLRMLLTTTVEPIDLDMGVDGSLYSDQSRSAGEIVRVSRSGGVAREGVPNLYNGAMPLPDGRALTTIRQAGAFRIVTIAPGRPPAPFVPTTSEETRPPVALVGRDRIALSVGTGSARRIAIVSLADGRFVHSVVKGIPAGDATPPWSIAASPDGRTLYYAASGQIWSIPSAGGEPRRIRAGDSVAVDPHGQYLVVQVNERDVVRLFRVPLSGGEDTEIAIRSDLRVATLPGLAPNAIGRDGRLVVRVSSPAFWVWPPAILDPRTGQLTLIPGASDFDAPLPGWTEDGTIVTVAFRPHSRLWRFRPVK